MARRQGSYGGGHVGPAARPYRPSSIQNAFNNNRGYVPPSAVSAGAHGAPAPNPEHAPPPPVGGPPIDPAQQANDLIAGRNLALGNANATYQQGQLDQSYGYGDTGAANPYSRAALLQESFQRSQQGTLNSAGQGLYSGAYGVRQGENQHQYSIAEDANRRAYDQASYGVRYGQAQNAANYGVGMDDNAYQALMRALGLG